MAVDLNGRVAIVTGAARGIGRALVEGFVRSGARVVAATATPPAWKKRVPPTLKKSERSWQTLAR